SLTANEKLKGPDAERDQNEYAVLHLTDPVGEVAAGKYLVDTHGKLAYFVDPGINGVLKTRDDGTAVQKYEAPKARLMSLIIDGILTQKLPWSLVLIGVFIAIVLEFCGISSLPFAVGVYLPISASMPIFFGGIIRWLVDRSLRTKDLGKDTESSPGVLLSSGLIAGGAIAGISIAIFSLKEKWVTSLDLSKVFPELASSQWVPYVAFGVMALLVYSTGRKWILSGGSKKS
ncbi:MAG: OPT/YSL family transporter, partial [Bdellovibrionota bacterium]